MSAFLLFGWLKKIWDFLRRLFGLDTDDQPRSPEPEPEPGPAPPEPEPEPTPPVPEGRLIAIDAGHGGTDTGAVNQSVGIAEKDVTLAIAKKLKTILEASAHMILMTREDDVFVGLARRAQLANQAGTEIFVSIHCNSSEHTSATGIETYHHTQAPAAERELANKVQAAMMAAFPSHKNRGVKKANFLVLRETQMPACLVEVEFISNHQQAQFLADPQNQQQIAQAIANGIAAYFQQP